MSSHHLRDTQSISSEWRGEGRCGVGVLRVRSSNSWVNERDNSTKFRRDRESWVGANAWDADNERVGVLLCSDKASGSGNSPITGSQLGENVIGLGELCEMSEMYQRGTEERSLLPHGLAAASKNWMDPPARVAACPEVPRSVRAPMAVMAPFPCS